jgi:ribosome biogenesis GTPase
LFTLQNLGWSDHFSDQIDARETPARVTGVARNGITALGPEGSMELTTPNPTGNYAVGDWIIFEGLLVTRLLERTTTIARRAVGDTTARQLIAANVDTLAIVTSCNADFNPARLERYLALCASAGARPLVILTKADLATDSVDPEALRLMAETLAPNVTALTLNAKDPGDVERLAQFCQLGQTLALIGSSGVGKTTLQNGLTGLNEATAAIRDDDAKGRHTTTARSLRQTQSGGWLIDTPGIRELRLSDAYDGIETVFSDLIALSYDCKFSDCSHEHEPDCTLQMAVASGQLDPLRIARWKKLVAEDRENHASTLRLQKRQARKGPKSKNGRK